MAALYIYIYITAVKVRIFFLKASVQGRDFSAAGLQPQLPRRLADTKHGHTFHRGKAVVGDIGSRVRFSIILANHLQAGYAALHAVMLEHKERLHTLCLYILLFSAFPAPVPRYLERAVLNL